MDEPQGTRWTIPPPAGRLSTKELAESRLRGSGYLALEHLSCEFRAGVLTLRGRLPSYYLKQVAQAVVTTVEGVERIDNQIQVVPPPSGAGRAGPGARNP